MLPVFSGGFGYDVIPKAQPDAAFKFSKDAQNLVEMVNSVRLVIPGIFQKIQKIKRVVLHPGPN